MTDATLIFESAEGAQLFSALYPHAPNLKLSLEQLLAEIYPKPLPSRSERETAFAALLPDDTARRAPSLLFTIEKMREALILSPEEVEHCFAELPDTPAHAELFHAMKRYLDSPLAEDRTQRIISLIDQLKEGTVSFGAGPEVLFVKALHPSASFVELALHFDRARGVEKARAVELWELESGHGEKGPAGIVLHADLAPSLERLGERIATLIGRGVDPNDIVVPFGGEPRALHWLRQFLCHRRIPFRSLFPTRRSPERKPLDAGSILALIRRDRSRPLEARLRCAAKLLGDTATRRLDVEWPEYFKKVFPDEVDYLLGLLAAHGAGDEAPDSEATEGVLLLPFQALPLDPGRHALGFVDSSYLQPPRSGLCLKEGDLELLHQKGYSIARATTYRARVHEHVSAFTARAHGSKLLFTPLERGAFPHRGKAYSLADNARSRRHSSEVPFENGERYGGEWLEAKLQAPLASPLSATQLETYSKCGALYFLTHRLKLRPKDTSDERYPILFGQAVHSAFENYFKKRRSGAVQPDRMVDDLVAEFAAAVRALAPTLEEKHPLFVILRENFARLARHVPSLEARLGEVTPGFTPDRFEEPFEIAFGDLILRGKIDRIDRRSDGMLLILDYKTGNVDFTPEHMARGTHFQALLYLLAAEKLFEAPCVGLLFYDLKKAEIRRGVLVEGHVPQESKKLVTRGHVLSPDKYEDLRKRGMEQLESLASSLSAGIFNPVASPDSCLICDYAALCRKKVGYV